MTALVTHKYKPRAYFQAFHARTERFAVLVCHRRAGKTVAIVNDMVVRAMRTRKKNWQGAYVCPFSGQAKKNSWKYFLQAIADIPGAKSHESGSYITFPNGAKIFIIGAKNYDALRGDYYDYVVLDEVAQIPRHVWTQAIRPGIRDRKGSVVFMGTPKGRNFFFDMAQRAQGLDSNGRLLPPDRAQWFWSKLDIEQTMASSSPPLSRSEYEDEKREAEDEEWQQEWMCSFDASFHGAYYAKHINLLQAAGNIVKQELFVAHKPVCVAMDLGFRDACAAWFWQVVGGEIRWIDYMEETGKDAGEIATLLDAKPYEYQTIWLPHDAYHRTFQSKKSVYDILKENHLPLWKVPNPDGGASVENGINAARYLLRTFPMRFNSILCGPGIEALKNYSQGWDHKNNTARDGPKHDRWSHGADAFRYAALSIQRSDLERSIEVEEREKNASKGINTGYTLQQAIDEHQRALARKRNGPTRTRI